MYRMRHNSTAPLALVFALLLIPFNCSAGAAPPMTPQRRSRPRTTPPPSKTNTNAPPRRAVAAATAQESRLTGVYRLDHVSSEDPRATAERVSRGAPFGQQEMVAEQLATRLSSPEQLAIQRRGRLIDIASSRAPRISFEADGRERAERASDGHTVYTRAVLYGDQLMVSSRGSRDDEYSVSFDPINNGRRLRVTRRIFVEQINQQVVVQSIYNKTSNVARWSVYGERLPPEPTVTA